MLKFNGKEITLTKGKKVYVHGQENLRKNRGCPVCGEVVEAGEGYCLVNTNTATYVHKGCRYHTDGTNKETAETVVNMRYDVKLIAPLVVIEYLSTMGWKRSNANMTSYTFNNTNVIKILDVFPLLSTVIISVSNDDTEEVEKVTLHKVSGLEVHQTIDDIGRRLGKYRY